MRKSIYVLMAGALIALASCGQSAEEKAAEQKRIEDSVAAAESAMKAAEEAAMAAMAADTTVAVDSTMADSTAAK